MAIRISRADIERLAGKLDQLGSALTESERAVLRVLCGLASEAVATPLAEEPRDARPGRGLDPILGPDQEPAVDSLPRLAAGFENAFQPGPAASFDLDDAATAGDEAAKTAIKVRLV